MAWGTLGGGLGKTTQGGTYQGGVAVGSGDRWLNPKWAQNTTPAASTATSAAASAGPGYDDISALFREALASLSGEGEKAYQTGKRRSMADIAMQSVNSGMANTLNMPAANIAYDETNRPAFNVALGTQKANILTGLGQTAAGMYGQNLGAQTSLQTANIGAGTSMSNAALGYQTNSAQQTLEKYMAELRAAQGGFYTGAFAR